MAKSKMGFGLSDVRPSGFGLRTSHFAFLPTAKNFLRHLPCSRKKIWSLGHDQRELFPSLQPFYGRSVTTSVRKIEGGRVTCALDWID